MPMTHIYVEESPRPCLDDLTASEGMWWRETCDKISKRILAEVKYSDVNLTDLVAWYHREASISRQLIPQRRSTMHSRQVQRIPTKYLPTTYIRPYCIVSSARELPPGFTKASISPSTEYPLEPLLWQGSYVPAVRTVLSRVSPEVLDYIADTLDDLIVLWTHAKRIATRRVRRLWSNQETTAGARRAGLATSEWARVQNGPQTYLKHRRTLRTELSKLCDAKAMSSIGREFQYSLSHIRHALTGASEFTVDSGYRARQRFADAVESSGLENDFINHEVIPWIESHGPNALIQPSLVDAEIVFELMSEELRAAFVRDGECFSPDHIQGTQIHRCTMCALSIVLAEMEDENRSSPSSTETFAPMIVLRLRCSSPKHAFPTPECRRTLVVGA